MRPLRCLAMIFALLALVGCETTDSGYGYFASGLDEPSIRTLFEEADRAVNERDFVTYKSLFSPRFSARDKDPEPMGSAYGGLMPQTQSFSAYIEGVEALFEQARELSIHTTITDIEVLEPGSLAKVIVQEDQYTHMAGEKQRLMSMLEIEVGYDEGWIYFAKSTRMAKQEID